MLWGVLQQNLKIQAVYQIKTSNMVYHHRCNSIRMVVLVYICFRPIPVYRCIKLEFNYPSLAPIYNTHDICTLIHIHTQVWCSSTRAFNIRVSFSYLVRKSIEEDSSSAASKSCTMPDKGDSSPNKGCCSPSESSKDSVRP